MPKRGAWVVVTSQKFPKISLTLGRTASKLQAMDKSVHDTRPALISAAGALLVVIAVFLNWQPREWTQWLVLFGATCAASGAWWFTYRLREPDRELILGKDQLHSDRERLDKQQRALEVFKTDVEEEALLLEKRRHKLSLQLSQTVGWWNLEERPEEGVSEVGDSEREREVLVFCKHESERLFNKVINNEYVIDGVLQPEEVYRDVIHLFEGVAKVYQPDSDQPLMETSLEQVLRFLHNVSLQLLVQLEQLPLDVKSFNLREAYRFMKKAVDYYGMYKKVNPYWNYAKPAIMLGRFALGANPVALGITWTLTELASLGGKKISSRYTRKYGLRMFHETIRIIGSETASVYGADFRDRDPDWVYSTELVDLVHQFPPTRESLEGALKEIGSLPMRSEYDRVYLYRCMANRFSAKPKNGRARDIMAMEECVRVAQRLEVFYQRYFPGEDADRVRKWVKRVESRLGVQIQVGTEVPAVSHEDQWQAAFYSLASYLLGHKMLELDAVDKRLSKSRCAAAMEATLLSKALLHVREAPPMVFDYPSCSLSMGVADCFLADLIDCQLGVFPRETEPALAKEAAVYFREKPELWVSKFHEKCKEIVLGQLLAEAPQLNLDTSVCQALLGDLRPDERLQLIYPVTSIEGPVVFKEEYQALVLIGTNKRPLLVLGVVEEQGHPMPLWKVGGTELLLKESKTFLTQALSLQGGVWNQDLVRIEEDKNGRAPAIRLRSRRNAAQEHYFTAFRERVAQLAGPGLADDSMEGLGEPLS